MLKNQRLNIMEESMVTKKEVYIPNDHKSAIVMENDKFSMESKLTKGDTIPRPASTTINKEISDIT